MIDWLLSNHRHFVAFSRWIILACGAGLLGIASLPPTPLDRIVAIVGICLIGMALLVWLVIALVTIVRPRTFAELRRRRAEVAARRIEDIFR